MGSLAAAVRAGRVVKDTGSKLYYPTGIMLMQSSVADLEKLTEAQRKAIKAEEKRNRKLARQQFLSGKARRRQELDNLRALHNKHVRDALVLCEAKRNAFLTSNLSLLAPFVGGAKRHLQASLGLIAPDAADEPRRRPRGAPRRPRPAAEAAARQSRGGRRQAARGGCADASGGSSALASPRDGGGEGGGEGGRRGRRGGEARAASPAAQPRGRPR